MPKNSGDCTSEPTYNIDNAVDLVEESIIIWNNVFVVNQRFIHTVIIATWDQKRTKGMINKIKSIICKIKGHYLIYAGQCPFTGARYELCERCQLMISIDEVTE